MPDQSHSAYQYFELTVTNKADLYTRATFHLHAAAVANARLPRKKPSHWLQTVGTATKCATKPRNVAGASDVCPECKQHATLINDNTDVPRWLRSRYESSDYATCQPAHHLDEQTQKMKLHLLQDIRRSATFIASIAAAATPAKSKFLPHHTRIRRRTFWH